MNDDLKVIQKMLGALLRHQGLMQWIDCYAVGSNNGGRYVSLFNSNAKFRLCAVYEESFKKLPDFIDSGDEAGEISTDRTRLETQGILKRCNGFMITRYQIGGGDTDDLAKWRFGDVLYVSGRVSAQNGNGAVTTVSIENEPPPDLAGQSVNGAAPAVNLCTEEQKQAITELGGRYFGPGWNVAKQRQWAESVSTGRASAIHMLNPAEADQLIGGLQFLVTARQSYGEQEVEKISAILGYLSRQDDAEYRLACDLPVGKSATAVARMIEASGAEAEGAAEAVAA